MIKIPEVKILLAPFDLSCYARLYVQAPIDNGGHLIAEVIRHGKPRIYFLGLFNQFLCKKSEKALFKSLNTCLMGDLNVRSVNQLHNCLKPKFKV